MDELNPTSSQVKVYRDVHRVLEEIAKAFAFAKKENLRRFLAEMQDKANGYLKQLSASDFHGEIHLRQTTRQKSACIVRTVRKSRNRLAHN